MFLNLIHAGAFAYGFSLFVTPLADDLGWSRTAISAVWATTLGVSILLSPFIGVLIDRQGGRRMVWAGMPMFGLAFIAMSRLDIYAIFLLVVASLMGLGLAVGIIPPGEAEVAYWFRRRRGLAMGIATSGTGIAGLILVPLIARSIDSLGWQTTAAGLGLGVIVLTYPLGLMLRGRPYEAASMVTSSSATQFSHESRDEPVFSGKEALATPAFWLLNLVIGLHWFGVTLVSVHQVPYLEERGYLPATAALVLGGAMAVSMPSRLLFGWLGDRTNLRRWLVAALAFEAAAIAVLIVANSGWLLPIYALLFGIGAAVLPLSSALVAEFFGRRNYATVQGNGRPIGQMARILGAMIGGLIFDLLGGYQAAFILAGVGFLVAIVLLLNAHPPMQGLRPEFPEIPLGGDDTGSH